MTFWFKWGDGSLHDTSEDGGRFKIAGTQIVVNGSIAVDHTTGTRYDIVAKELLQNTLSAVTNLAITVENLQPGANADPFISIGTANITTTDRAGPLATDDGATPANEAPYRPTGAALSNTSIVEHAAAREIGTLTGIDRNGGETFTYAVVNGGAQSAHSHFAISADGTKLVLVDGFDQDFESDDPLLQTAGGGARKYYVVYVNVTDSTGLSNVQRFEIDVVNVQDDDLTPSRPQLPAASSRKPRRTVPRSAGTSPRTIRTARDPIRASGSGTTTASMTRARTATSRSSATRSW